MSYYNFFKNGLNEHYKNSNSNFLVSSFGLLEKILKYVFHVVDKNNKANVFNGFGFHELPLLVSYPRSGTNWARYIIESITNRPTPGSKCRYDGKNFIIDRAHKAYPVMNRYDSVILLIRNYKECLLRQNSNWWNKTNDIKVFLNSSLIFPPADWYIKNIIEYDKYKGNKICIYYEDLITESVSEIKGMSRFLNCNNDKVEEFINNLEYHFKNSVSKYQASGHKSNTAKERKTNYHSSKNLTTHQSLEFDNYYSSKYPRIFNRYLKRYDER